MPRSLRSSNVGRPYLTLVTRWKALGEDDRARLVDSFAVDFAFPLCILQPCAQNLQ